MRMGMVAAVVVATLVFGAPGALAAEPAPIADGAPAPSGPQQDEPERSAALRVFLDCDHDCDFDYLRREITWVNWVRDREDSQVHLLVTTRDSAAGEEYDLAFIGREDFEGTEFTHLYFASETNTDDETRLGYAQVMRIGLLQFTVGTAQMERVAISEPEGAAQPGEASGQAVTQPGDDPWNFWVFTVGANAWGSGEERRNDLNASTNFSANRTTPDWKILNSLNLRYSTRYFEYSDGSSTKDITEDYGWTSQVVKSLGPHWGASIKAEVTRSTFLNQDLSIAAAPGVEFNLYPYEESSRRQWIFRYEFGFNQASYEEVTLYDKNEEFLVDHTFITNWDLNQPWGESEIAVEYANYLDDFSAYHIILSGNIDIRITRGLSFDIGGELSQVRDQRYIPKRDLADEEVLLRRRDLETDYRWELRMGISYRFGSIFNNVVNPRFGGGRGGFDRFFH